jgi:chemotaxis protein methyltransferase CheR
MKRNIENIEVELLLEAIYKYYGYDFRDYAKASIKRRIISFLSSKASFLRAETGKISQLIPLILYDENLFQQLLLCFSVTVTEIFRDPELFKSLRERVVPYLKTFPHIKVWHAGCSTGEEVYSMAIILKEEGIYDKSTIYATDFNDEALMTAKKGIYKLDTGKNFIKNYQKSGGKSSFADYYHAKYDAIIIDNSLKKNITFANHNLVLDGSFGEMHLILCRNVLIYFNKTLQNRIFNLFNESLCDHGFLALGSKESLRFTEAENKFSVFDEKWKIYQKSNNGI